MTRRVACDRVCKRPTRHPVYLMSEATALVIVTQRGPGSRSLEAEHRQVSEQSRKEGVALGAGLYTVRPSVRPSFLPSVEGFSTGGARQEGQYLQLLPLAVLSC